MKVFGYPRGGQAPRIGAAALRRLAAAAVATATVAGIWDRDARAEQAAFTDFPFVIYCEFESITHAYYFSRLRDEEAVYMTPDRQAGIISVDGVAHRVGGDRSGTCRDKTLEELRRAGQAFDLPR